MGPRHVSPTTTQFPLPEIITLDDDDDGGKEVENIGSDEDDIDAESFIWKSEMKALTNANNVINKKQTYKSNSCIIHAALDACSKQKKDQKPPKRNVVKAVKDMTEEEIRKELSVVNVRRDELLKALATFEKKKKETKEEQKSANAPKPPQSRPAEEEVEKKKSANVSRPPSAISPEEAAGTRIIPSRLKNAESPLRRKSISATPPVETPQCSKKLLRARRFSSGKSSNTSDKENSNNFSPVALPLQERILSSRNQNRVENAFSTVLSQPPNVPALSSTATKSPASTRKKHLISPRKRMSMGTYPLQGSQSVINQLTENGDLVQVVQDIDTRIIADSVAEVPQTIEEIVHKCPVIPYSKDYDPVNRIAGHRATSVMHEMDKQYKYIYYQPDLPDNENKMPFRKFIEKDIYYLFEIPEDRFDKIKRQIRHLGGTVTNRLCKASRVIFYPTEKELSNLFLFATAAIGGRYLLPVLYISDSYENDKFGDVSTSVVNMYANKNDIHPSISAAIKMANHYRDDYFKNRYPVFNRANVLLAVPRSEDEDVKLLLMILGAYVQRCYDGKKYLKNPLYTLCVTEQMVQLSEDAKLIPQAKPDDIRELLWKALDKFL